MVDEFFSIILNSALVKKVNWQRKNEMNYELGLRNQELW